MISSTQLYNSIRRIRSPFIAQRAPKSQGQCMSNISPCHICYVVVVLFCFFQKCLLNCQEKTISVMNSLLQLKKKGKLCFSIFILITAMRAFKLTGARRAPRELLSRHLGFVHFGSQGPFFTENKDDNQYSTNRHPAVLHRAEIHYATMSHQCMRSYRTYVLRLWC